MGIEDSSVKNDDCFQGISHSEVGGITDSPCWVFNSIQKITLVSSEQRLVQRSLRHVLNPINLGEEVCGKNCMEANFWIQISKCIGNEMWLS